MLISSVCVCVCVCAARPWFPPRQSMAAVASLEGGGNPVPVLRLLHTCALGASAPLSAFLLASSGQPLLSATDQRFVEEMYAWLGGSKARATSRGSTKPVFLGWGWGWGSFSIQSPIYLLGLLRFQVLLFIIR
jgi:hypothetical protein